MPFSKEKYPSNWCEFSEYIRFERAGNKCEQCGAENYQPHPETGSKVVLTVAHLDGIGDVCDCESKTGQKCANEAHVLALCQRDHLRYDIERHKFNARRSRAAKMEQQWFADWDSRFPQENT